jgi:prevent-host-death family protein
MNRTIPQRELRNDNAQVIDAVVSGETFVVTRNGVPVAELRPIPRARRTFVPKRDVLDAAATGPHVDRENFRADLDRIVLGLGGVIEVIGVGAQRGRHERAATHLDQEVSALRCETLRGPGMQCT